MLVVQNVIASQRSEPFENEWVASAFERTRARLDNGWRETLPWRRGLWATARTSYRRLPLPRGFEIVRLDAPGGPRRVALREGHGRPLLILPGLYAALEQALFCQLALAASLTERPVALLEDQLASPTLRLSGGRWASFAEQGEQAQRVARLFSSRPDVLALSMGAMVALSAPAGAWHHLAAWSAVVDGSTVARVQSSRILSWHYRREHARAFRAAGLAPPALEELLSTLFRPGPPPAPSCPALFIHAADDPVAPVDAVRARIVRPLITRWGGHLGFAAAGDANVYLSPFGSAAIEVRAAAALLRAGSARQ